MERQVCRAAEGGDLIALLVQVLQKPSHDLKQQLAVYSKRVAGCVTELIQAAEAMKGWFAACSAPPQGHLSEELDQQTRSFSLFQLSCLLQGLSGWTPRIPPSSPRTSSWERPPPSKQLPRSWSS